MKVAALDLGSNTFLCLIAEVQGQQITKIYADQTEVVRLGQGLSQSKKFHPEALARADRCLSRFAQLIQVHNPEKVLAMATSAARDAENREDLFEICKKHQIPIEIIDGEKEAAITYEGATSAIVANQKKIMVIDIGGGSTEFIFGIDRQLLRGESYNIGSVRLTEKFISNQPTPLSEVQLAVDFIEEHIERAFAIKPKDFSLDEIIAVAGTPTALVVAILGQFDPARVDGFQLSLTDLENWSRRLIPASVQQKIDMGIPQGRADVILIGVLILIQTLKKFNQKTLSVSTRGVRYGVALEMDRRRYLGSQQP